MAAASKPQVQVRGAAEFRKAMKKAGADMSDLTAANKASADVVAAQARTLVPILSGTLAATIRTSATRTRAAVLAGGNLVPYAGPIHFGWPAHRIEPHPFLYDAAEDKTQEVIEVYQQRVDKMIRKVEATTPP